MTRSARSLVVLVLALLLPGCWVFHDQAGVPLDPSLPETIQPGWTREEVMELAGPPTGVYSIDLLTVVTRLNRSFDQLETQGRRDDDVLTWQEVELNAKVFFFPVLFFWVNSRIHTKTLMVLFDEDGLVTQVLWREDTP